MVSKSDILNVLKGRWPSISFFAEGGNSWVYRIDEGEARLILKVLRRSDRFHRFRDEIKAAGKLGGIAGIVPIRSANLPSSLKYESVQTIPFFIMPFLEGGTLAGKLSGRLVADGGKEAVKAIVSVAQILQDIHSKNLAHRDLHPDNVLIDSKGSIFVSDFGLCIDLENDDERNTESNEIIGPIWYRGPEYFRGRLDTFDHRPGDVYSVGRILWSLLVGKHPKGMTDREFDASLVSQLVPGLHRPALLNQLIRDCTNPQPSMRPTISDLITVLTEWGAAEPKDLLETLKTKVQSDASFLQRKAQRLRELEPMQTAGAIHDTAMELLRDSALYRTLQALEGTRVEIFIDGDPANLKEIFPYVDVRTPGFWFNPLDAAEILPRLDIICPVGVDPQSSKAVYKIVVAVTPRKQDPEPKIFAMEHVDHFDSVARAKLEQALRQALEWLSEHLNK